MIQFGLSSYKFIQETIRRNRGTAALLSNKQIESMLSQPPVDGVLEGTIIGEALLRRWLYCFRNISDNACCPELPIGGLQSRFTELLEKTPDHSPLSLQEIERYETQNEIEDAAKQHLTRRIRFFLECDGIIPVATDYADDALAIPFKIHGDGREASITDRTGQPLPQWKPFVQNISTSLKDQLTIELLCETGDLAEHLHGSSIGLAISIAYLAQKAFLPQHSPLALIGTGICESGILQVTGSIEAKKKLAGRLNAHLIYPASTSANQDLPAVNDNLDTLKKKLSRIINDLGIAINPTPPVALKRLLELDLQVHKGELTSDTTERILQQLDTVFTSSSSSPYSREGLVRSTLLRGQLANHAGRPNEAHSKLKEAIDAAKEIKNPTLYTRATTNLIVSLTDLGLVGDAENIGKIGLKDIDQTLPGNAEEIEQCRMALHGALGQTQRAKALLSEIPLQDGSSSESYHNLTEALRIAEELEAPSEICRDQTEILLWYALIKPKDIQPVFSDTIKLLHRFSSTDHNVSEWFALRSRWLAAYRLYLTEGTVSDDYENLELPDCREGGYTWVYGTAQKYRGTLLAAAGKNNAARTAFSQAIEIMTSPEQPLLHFIGATTALQAGEILKDKDYLQTALTIFEEQHDHSYGKIKGLAWKERTQSLLKGQTPGTNPQLHFQY